MMDYRTYQLNNKERIGVGGFLAMGLLVTGWLVYDTWLAILLVPLLFRPVEKRASLWLCGRRQRAMRDQFRDCLYSFSASFASGRHMGEACQEASKQLEEIYGADALLVQELQQMDRQVGKLRREEGALWQSLGERSGLEDIAEFAHVFLCCTRSGGNLAGAMNRAASILTDKIAVESEIRSLLYQKKIEGRLIGAMPVAILLFLRLSAPDYTAVLYETMAGRWIMTGCLAATMGAIYLEERMMQIAW